MIRLVIIAALLVLLFIQWVGGKQEKADLPGDEPPECSYAIFGSYWGSGLELERAFTRTPCCKREQSPLSLLPVTKISKCERTEGTA